MNTIILYISDIHFTGKRAENEGVVINAFIRDAKKQLEETQTIKKNVVQSLRDTLHETYDQLSEGMGNGVIDEYVNYSVAHAF